jgi:hypothetical protein
MFSPFFLPSHCMMMKLYSMLAQKGLAPNAGSNITLFIFRLIANFLTRRSLSFFLDTKLTNPK